jgi:hypothetical protein
MGVDVLMAKYDEPVVDTSTTTSNYSGMSGTDIATQIRNANAAKNQAAQAAATKPEINAAGQARGDQLQWNPKTQQYQIIKGVNTVQGPLSGSGGGQSTGGGTTNGTDNSGASQALNNLAAATAAQTAQAQATQAQAQQNAISFLTTTFTDYGLGADIANAVTDLVKQGYTADTIQIMAQDPKSTNPLAKAFQQRFPANAARMAAGLPVLSPSEYIATERSYAQVMNSYGLNSNFATNKDIFTKLLTNDISPTELNSRASTAKQVIENTDPAVTQQLQQYYGLSQGDMIAHVLDPAVATPIIEKQISAAQIGAESARYNANVGQSYAEQLSGLGVTQAQANQGFRNIAEVQPGTQALAARYGAYGPAGQVGSALQAATFGTTGSVQAQQELDRLKTQEISAFSGSSGVGKGSLLGAEEGVS